MLELIIASTLMTMVLATVSVVMRTGRLAWEAHESDFTRLEAAHATLRHIVRTARQAQSVVAITNANDPSGSLAIRMPTGETYIWAHNTASNAVYFGVNAANSLLADNVSELSFTAYRADGVTPTTNVTEIQNLKITVTVQLARDTNATRTVSSWVWIRTW